MFVGQDDDENKRSVEAAQIYIECKDDPHLPRQKREWMSEWMRQSPENVACLIGIFDVSRKLDRLKLADRKTQLSAAPPRQPSFAFGRRALLMGGVAAIAVSVGSLSLLGSHADGKLPIQHVMLPDGSVLYALRGSDFKVEFSDDVRLIRLRQGEIVCEVTKDPRHRPFIVRGPISDTIAVGTRFGVAATSSETITTVSEGEVRVVTPAGGERTSGTAVRAGEELRVVVGTSQPESVLAVRAERKISWAAGWLEFEGETAEEAVNAFNRFVNVRIEITQPELAGARLRYGRFQLDKPESFAAAVGNAVHAPVTRNSKRNVIYIGERPE